jgi:hypothetical protein
MIRFGTVINHPEVLKHSSDSIPDLARQYVLKSNTEKGCKIPDRLLKKGGMGGHLTHAFREILYACGLNGRQEVEYKKGEEIKISPKGTSILQDVLRD